MSQIIYNQIMTNKESYFYQHNGTVIRVTFDTHQLADKVDPKFFDWLVGTRDDLYIVLNRKHFLEWFKLILNESTNNKNQK